jgi:hypothetical protein
MNGKEETVLRRIIGTLAVVVLSVFLVGGVSFAVQVAENGETKLISGEVVSVWNYLVRDQHGEEYRGSGVRLAEKGLPIGILDDESGEIYIAVVHGPGSAVRKLVPYMGMKVNAQGPVYHKAGVNLIEIQVVAEQ